jgi:hypothetical protein
MNSLPLGAKLDYREDVDKLHANVMEKVTASQEMAEKALARSTKLVKQIQDVLVKQQKILTASGHKLGEGNPIVTGLKDKLTGIDDLAKLSREHEMKLCNSLGLTPKDGWAMTLARLTRPAKEGRTMGELSKILLREEKSEKSSDGDHAKQRKFVENVGDVSNASVKKISSGRKNEKTPKNTKRVVKRMKI